MPFRCLRRSAVSPGLIFVLAALLWPTVGHPASYDEIVRQFAAIAFSSEDAMPGTIRRTNAFERWSGPPVLVRRFGRIDPVIHDVLAQLRVLSGLDIRIAEPANVFVHFGRSQCRGLGYTDRVDVTIGTISTVHCVYEELAQTIGPTDDACEYRPSIFCDLDFPVTYNEADKIILRTTFDPRLRNGMTREEGMPIARQIIRELYEEQYGPIREDDGERDAKTDAESTDRKSVV